jgi:hypothetical protein
VAEFDYFADQLLGEAKRFLEKASGDGTDAESEAAYLHAALMLSFCGLEARMNSLSDDAASFRSDLSAHDKGILLEKEVRLEHGAFIVSPTTKIYRMEDRIAFLHLRLSGKALDRDSVWWSELSSAIKLRNDLTHPKAIPEINVAKVERAIKSIIDTIDALSRAIYQKKYPAASDGLVSRMSF